MSRIMELHCHKDRIASACLVDYRLVQLNRKQTVLYNIKSDLVEVKDLSLTDAVTFNLLNDTLNQWEMNTKKPIWIESEDTNALTTMIYEDLMNKNPIRVQAPADLNKLK